MKTCGCSIVQGNLPVSSQTVSRYVGDMQGHFYKVLQSLGLVNDLSPFAQNFTQTRDPHRGTTLNRIRKYIGIGLTRLGAAACASLLVDRFLHYIDPAHYMLVKNKMSASNLFHFCTEKTEDGYALFLGSKNCSQNSSFNLEMSFFGLLISASIATYLFGKVLTPMKFDSQIDAAYRGVQFLAKELDAEASLQNDQGKQLLLVGHWALVLEAMSTHNKEFIEMMRSSPAYQASSSEVIEEDIYQLGGRLFSKLFKMTKNELYNELAVLYSSKAPCRLQ